MGWLKHRDHSPYDFKRRLNYNIKSISLFIVYFVAIILFYTNADRLNQINLWFIKLSGVLIIISLFFLIKYGIKILSELINIIKRQNNGIRSLIFLFIIVLAMNVYFNSNTALNPLLNFYDKTNFSLISPISFNLSAFKNTHDSNNSLFEGVSSVLSSPKIDDIWVNNFMSLVNEERKSRGLSGMQESTQLNSIATLRFNKMMEQPFISHYGADEYNVGEVIYYPDGKTEQEEADDIKATANLHWENMMTPSYTHYGYHIEEGQTLSVYEPCSITEIVGANVNEKEFFQQHGCRTEVTDSIWLVIDMS